MRWSNVAGVGLSGTSLALALAMTGCSATDDAKKPAETVAATDSVSEAAELEAVRSKQRELEAQRTQDEEARRLADRNAASEPSPWFLRRPDDTNQAPVQAGTQGKQPVQHIAPNPAQPKPVQPPPNPTPTETVRHRPFSRQALPCGRG
jgi:hypothetical protein